MSYCAYDENDYVGDVASIGGWAAFAIWAAKQGGPIAQFIEDGMTTNPAGLASALLAAPPAADDNVESVADNLAELAGKAVGVFIISQEG